VFTLANTFYRRKLKLHHKERGKRERKKKKKAEEEEEKVKVFLKVPTSCWRVIFCPLISLITPKPVGDFSISFSSSSSMFSSC